MNYSFFLISLCIVLSFNVKAEIFKCVEGGKTTYTDEICKSNGKRIKIREFNSIPKVTNKAVKRTNQKKNKSINILNPGAAITISSLKCIDGGKGSGTIYKGVVKNVSRNGIYSAKLKASFFYRVNREEFQIWDTQNKYFKLKPMQFKRFQFEGRIAPDSFEMKCSLNTTKRFIESIYNR